MVGYNQDEDPTGMIGMAFADIEYSRRGWDAFRENGEGELYARVARIALQRFPELQRGEHILGREIRKRLSAIRRAGYDVRPCSKMDIVAKWNYLMEIRRNVRRKAEQYCPDVLVEVDSDNLRRREEARTF